MAAAQVGPVQQTIEQKLTDGLSPSVLDVLNESHKHAVPRDSETHFKVVIVADVFNDMSLIERHRAVQGLLAEELSTGGVHALSITAKTPAQWAKKNTVPDTPNCLGGSKHDRK